MSMQQVGWAVVAVFTAMVLALLKTIQEVPVDIPDPVLVEHLQILYSEKPHPSFAVAASSSSSTTALPAPELDLIQYNIVELQAPHVIGPALAVVSWIMARSWIRPFWMRALLKDNGVHHLRQLAAALPQLAPLFYPMTRLLADEHDFHVRLATLPPEDPAPQDSSALLPAAVPPPHPPITSPYRSIMDYHRLYQTGRATPTQVLDRILEAWQHRLEPALHIMASVQGDLVRQQAAESTARYQQGQPLSVWDGVPVAFKDAVRLFGHQACDGAKNCGPNIIRMEDEEELVNKFRQAGAVLFGLTVMDEHGLSPLGYNLWWDGPLNPYDTNAYPGGSSSGSGVVVATGLVPVAIGIDGGGSIRMPSSYCGIFGLATTWGRLPQSGASVHLNSKFGPLTATAHDAALAYHLMASGPSSDPQDYMTMLYDGGLLGKPPAHVHGYHDSVRGMRLGIFWEHFSHADREVVDACWKAVEFLQQQGAVVVNITIPYLKELHMSHGITILSEFGMILDADYYSPGTHRKEYKSDISLALGKSVTAVEVLAAQRIRAFGHHYMRHRIFGDLQIDAVVSPTSGVKVPPHGKGSRGWGESDTVLIYRVMRFVTMANLLGFPAMSIPVGYDQDEQHHGKPIGLQVMADAWMDHKLLRLAATLEAQFIQRRTPPAPYFLDPLAPWL